MAAVGHHHSVWWRMRIRIVQEPPGVIELEGFDLRPYDFQRGLTYDVDYRLGEVLLAWQYAEPERRAVPRRPNLNR
jgi:hypothetical protein